MLKKIQCECGKRISFRTLKTHLNKSHHTQTFIDEMMSIIKLNRENRIAWLKKDGKNAISADFWGISVLSKETRLSDWTFESPRKRGAVTPKTAQKMSINRIGEKNPVNKKKLKYRIGDLKIVAQNIWNEIQNEDLRLNILWDKMEKKFPFFSYSMSSMFTAKNLRGQYRNSILAFFLDLSLNDIVLIRRKDRGKKIKKGQNNPITRAKLLATLKKGKESQLAGFITNPQRKLLNLIRSIMDKSAHLEKQIDYLETWKSYDIYSPLYDVLFEMHGRIWHDLNSCPENLKKIVHENIKNDKIKTELAKKIGKRLFVFWDDQEYEWSAQLNKILKELQNEN